MNPGFDDETALATFTYRGGDGCPLFATAIGPAEVSGILGETPVVVLLHAGGPDHRSLIPLARKLTSDHCVLLPDVRGYGRSICTDPSHHTWAQYADDVIGLLDYCGIRRAVIGGAGLGTTICAPPLPTRTGFGPSC